MKNLYNFHTDEPSEVDELGFKELANTLGTMICSSDFQTPFCIGIYGGWGTGKTSFMKILQGVLLDKFKEKTIIPVWFNPWRYSREEHLIIPFLKTVQKSLEENASKKNNFQIQETLLKAATRIGRAAVAICYGLQFDIKLNFLGFKFDGSKAIDREEKKNKEVAGSERNYSDQLCSVYFNINKELEDIIDEKVFQIIVFIDDLDRCLPEVAVSLLESIKIFISVPGYLCIVGVSKDIIVRGISYRYRYINQTNNAENISEGAVINPEDYLDKLIQFPLELPPITPEKRQSFIKSFFPEHSPYRSHSDLVEMGVGHNPRTIKRFLNLLSFICCHADTLKERRIHNSSEMKENILSKQLNPLLLIKWSLIIFRFKSEYSMIRGYWRNLIWYQKMAIEWKKERKAQGDVDADLSIKLLEILSTGKHEDDYFVDSEEVVCCFLHLAASTLITENKDYITTQYDYTESIGELVTIPEGEFIFGTDDDRREITNQFLIDKFPITNTLFCKFLNERIQDLNHLNGLFDLEKSKIVFASNFKTEVGYENHPVTGVTKSGAEAYCAWRTERCREVPARQYRLPSEEQWEKAARGLDGRIYPWGNDPDINKFNVLETGLGTTTQVAHFSQSSSPFLCFDMCGNVWELTSTRRGGNKFVLKGGSWQTRSFEATTKSRNYITEVNADAFVGFRCVAIINEEDT